MVSASSIPRGYIRIPPHEPTKFNHGCRVNFSSYFRVESTQEKIERDGANAPVHSGITKQALTKLGESTIYYQILVTKAASAGVKKDGIYIFKERNVWFADGCPVALLDYCHEQNMHQSTRRVLGRGVVKSSFINYIDHYGASERLYNLKVENKRGMTVFKPYVCESRIKFEQEIHPKNEDGATTNANNERMNNDKPQVLASAQSALKGPKEYYLYVEFPGWVRWDAIKDLFSPRNATMTSHKKILERNGCRLVKLEKCGTGANDYCPCEHKNIHLFLSAAKQEKFKGAVKRVEKFIEACYKRNRGNVTRFMKEMILWETKSITKAEQTEASRQELWKPEKFRDRRFLASSGRKREKETSLTIKIPEWIEKVPPNLNEKLKNNQDYCADRFHCSFSIEGKRDIVIQTSAEKSKKPLNYAKPYVMVSVAHALFPDRDPDSTDRVQRGRLLYSFVIASKIQNALKPILIPKDDMNLRFKGFWEETRALVLRLDRNQWEYLAQNNFEELTGLRESYEGVEVLAHGGTDCYLYFESKSQKDVEELSGMIRQVIDYREEQWKTSTKDSNSTGTKEEKETMKTGYENHRPTDESDEREKKRFKNEQ